MADEKPPPSSPQSGQGPAGAATGSVTSEAPRPASPTGSVASETPPRPARREDPPSPADVIEYVKTYAKQETVGPLRGAGRWIGLGAAGAVVMGLGLSFLLLGLLRFLQSEWGRSASGRLSWLSYVVVLAVCLLLLGVVLSRINKTFINKEDK